VQHEAKQAVFDPIESDLSDLARSDLVAQRRGAAALAVRLLANERQSPTFNPGR